MDIPGRTISHYKARDLNLERVVALDGKSFLINLQNQVQNRTPLTLVVNWDAALRQ